MTDRRDGTTERVRALGRELRALHERIREVLDDALAGADPTALLLDVTAEPRARCRTVCSVLEAHHRAEDRVLFPWVLEHRPELEPVVLRLDEDHRLVAALLADLRSALDVHAPPETLVRHLEGIDAILESHFHYEERELVPVLDALGDLVPPDALAPELPA